MPIPVNRTRGGPLAGGAEPLSEPAPGAARRGRRPLRTARRALRTFARETRAAAGIELAIGAVVLITVAALCFDLYSRVEADAAGSGIAAVMADYVSRGPDALGESLDGDALRALGEFLREREFGVPADLVFVLSALSQPAGTPPPAVEVLWHDRKLRFGEPTVTAALANDCSRFVESSGGQNTARLPLPVDFTVAAGEVVVVVEVCARLTREGSLTGRFVTGNVYRHHVLPARTPAQGLPAPVYAQRRRGVGADALAFHAAAGLPAWAEPRPRTPAALIPAPVGRATLPAAPGRAEAVRARLPGHRA